MKPGVDAVATGVLPQSRISAHRLSANNGAVDSPLTTSTSFIRVAGLKKCRPSIRCGWRKPAASAVIDRDEVLEASTVSAGSTSSSRRNSSCLASSRSTMASIAKAASASSDNCATGRSRRRAASSRSGVHLPARTRPAQSAAIASGARPPPPRPDRRDTLDALPPPPPRRCRAPSRRRPSPPRDCLVSASCHCP